MTLTGPRYKCKPYVVERPLPKGYLAINKLHEMRGRRLSGLRPDKYENKNKY